MDKQRTNHKGFRKYLWLIAIVAGITIAVYAAATWRYQSSVSLEREALSIATVVRAPFFEYINLTGQVEPRELFYVDSKVAGSVERLYAENGTPVRKGDTLMRLANADLQLEVLQRESQLIEQLNNQQQTALLLNQNNLSQQERLAEVRYQLLLQQKAFERSQQLLRDSVIAVQDFEPVANRYYYLQQRQNILSSAFRSDSLARLAQLKQMAASEQRIMDNLSAVRSILDRLWVKAPADGQLTDFQIQTGQAVESGERLGQIYSLDQPKIVAQADEFYLNKITNGQKGEVILNGDTLELQVEKIYPTVTEGRFRIEAGIIAPRAKTLALIRGQSLRLRLFFGTPSERTLLPNGNFYASTGGSWVYVLEEGKARKRTIELGRRNPDFFEVLNGLEAGDKIIRSGYDRFEDYETLNLN